MEKIPSIHVFPKSFVKVIYNRGPDTGGFVLAVLKRSSSSSSPKSPPPDDGFRIQFAD